VTKFISIVNKNLIFDHTYAAAGIELLFNKTASEPSSESLSCKAFYAVLKQARLIKLLNFSKEFDQINILNLVCS
jgi:hypothetical protein